MSERLQQPYNTFIVGILGESRWLYGIARNLARVDLVEDDRSSDINLSETIFLPHPLFDGEITNMNISGTNKFRKESVARFSLRTLVGYATQYRDNENYGYVPTETVIAITENIKSRLPNVEIELDRGFRNFPCNTITVRGAHAVIDIQFGESSLEAKLLAEERIEAQSKEPRRKPLRRQSESIDPVETEEEKAYKEASAKALIKKIREILAARPKTNDLRNDYLQISMRGVHKREQGTKHYMEAFLSGVPLTTSEDFRIALDFYSTVYAEVVNAFCEVVGIQPPNPRVLLGSRILKS